ncbi:MAG: hypothetical protein KC777_28480 [Cyanobacteria bacterium HKST-UBA02]|nr:hypothetical protein [Cyanobacteria bacterium HKST-UBA02]
MSNSKKTTVRLMMALILSTVVFALVQGPARAEGDAPCGHCNIDYEKLDLSNDQSLKIQQLDQQWFDTYQKMHPKIQEKQQQLKKLMASPNSDPTELIMLQQKIDKENSELKSFAISIWTKKKEILNDAQKEKLQILIRDELQKRQGRGGGREQDQIPIRWQKLLRNMQNIFSPDQK